MNAATGHIIKKAFGKYHKKCIKLLDSTVALHWISSKLTMLKTWVRTRVVEINCLCDASWWFYVDTKEMVADIGTRKGSNIMDVDESRSWISGLPWMSGPEGEFPTLTLEQIKISQQELNEANKETMIMKTFHTNQNAEVKSSFDEQIKLRYMFSNFLINPNKFRFRKVIRVFALVLKFVWKISKVIPKVLENIIFKHVPPGGLADILKFSSDRYIVTTGLVHDASLKANNVDVKVIELSEHMLRSSMTYFSLKSSKEVKHFLSKTKYQNITKEIDGIFYYSGRILEDYKFDGYPELCEATIDLCSTSFCVPVMDQYSPVAISIALEVHWCQSDVKHTGIEDILRKMLGVVFIIGGRKLAISIKRGCKKCRILHKKSVEVAMGPIQSINLCIAPAYYACQIDIFGPYKSYSLSINVQQLSMVSNVLLLYDWRH